MTVRGKRDPRGYETVTACDRGPCSAVGSGRLFAFCSPPRGQQLAVNVHDDDGDPDDDDDTFLAAACNV